MILFFYPLHIVLRKDDRHHEGNLLLWDSLFFSFFSLKSKLNQRSAAPQVSLNVVKTFVEEEWKWKNNLLNWYRNITNSIGFLWAYFWWLKKRKLEEHFVNIDSYFNPNLKGYFSISILLQQKYAHKNPIELVIFLYLYLFSQWYGGSVSLRFWINRY